jgi:hypothetical protein
MNSIAPAPPVAYVAYIGDPVKDRDAVLAVWHGALGQVSRPFAAKFDWFYLSCPWGKPLLELLEHTPTASCVGTAAAGPRRMLWQGREILAGVLVDMAVATKHRTLGPALMLQAGLRIAAAGRFDLLYGFPNPKSITVATRAGYPVIGALRRFSCVLRHGSYFARSMPRLLAQPLGYVFDAWRNTQRALRARRSPRLLATWCDRADPRMDELWLNSEHGNGLIAVRDTTLLHWRFDELPGTETRYLCLSEQHDGPLLAWFACQIDGSSLRVRDFWSCDAARGTNRTLIDALIRAARSDDQRHAAVSVEYAAPASKLLGWLAAGFVEREQQPIVGCWVNSTNDGQAMADFHLTAADEDE